MKETCQVHSVTDATYQSGRFGGGSLVAVEARSAGPAPVIVTWVAPTSERWVPGDVVDVEITKR